MTSLIRIEFKAEVEEIRGLYKKAEDRIKEIEHLWDGLPFPPVNQLRYAGYHILSALVETDEEKIKDCLKCAERHCKRAIYDAVDAGIIFCLKEIDIFKEDYKMIDITPTISDYGEILKNTREAKKLIDQARSQSDNRESYYDEATKYLRILEESRDRLNGSREELNKRIRKHNSDVLRANVMLVATVLMLVIGVFTLAVAIYYR